MKQAARLAYEEVADRRLKAQVDQVKREDATNQVTHMENMEHINELKTHILILLHRLETLPQSGLGFAHRFHMSESCLIDIERSKLSLYILQARETVNFATLHLHVKKIQEMVRARETRLAQYKHQTRQALVHLHTNLVPPTR